MKFLILDNYDSFVYNIAQYLGDLGVDSDVIALGEIGLSGEVRSVSQSDRRLREAARLGFNKSIMSGRGADKTAKSAGIKAQTASSLRDAIDSAFSPK